jgi:hypothetical protein
MSVQAENSRSCSFLSKESRLLKILAAHALTTEITVLWSATPHSAVDMGDSIEGGAPIVRVEK